MFDEEDGESSDFLCVKCLIRRTAEPSIIIARGFRLMCVFFLATQAHNDHNYWPKSSVLDQIGNVVILVTVFYLCI